MNIVSEERQVWQEGRPYDNSVGANVGLALQVGFRVCFGAVDYGFNYLRCINVWPDIPI